MTFHVIDNPQYFPKTGFTNAQFKKLDSLYLQAAGAKILNYRTVECDFDSNIATYTYYIAEGYQPYLQFLIKKVGPKTMMYEVYKQGKGRIAKSGVFEYAYKKVQDEVESLLTSA